MVDYRYLGRSALKVSPLSLGTMMFGGQTPDDVAFRIIDKAREQGINFIDTADVYNDGKSEEVVGRGIKANRDHWVLATKFVNSHKKGPNLGGHSRKWVIETVENSLRRLNTDYIDILYFHRAVFDAPLEEPVRAIADLIRAGKLRYFGVSNFRGWRIAEVSHLADQLGIDRPVASQPLYNIVNRTAEAEQLPAAYHYGLGVVSYSPLARGVLTGKYEPGQTPAADTRAGRGDKRILETEWRPESIAIAKEIAAHATRKGSLPDRVRARLGAEQQARLGGHHRAAHRGALGQLYPRTRRQARRRGRSTGRSPGDHRSSLDAGLQRSEPPGRRPCATKRERRAARPHRRVIDLQGLRGGRP